MGVDHDIKIYIDCHNIIGEFVNKIMNLNR